jgi:hypothetical protein
MGLIDESGDASQIAGLLNESRRVLSGDQSIAFQAYSRVVLPIDKYVYWQPTVKTDPVPGSLHVSQDIEQNEDETVGLAHVVFTTSTRITEFADAPPQTIFVATIGEFRFAFAQQNGRYEEAGQWHYAGRSIYPALASQLLDIPGAIDPKRAVTSNSLALWIALNSYKPIYGYAPKVELFPADIVDPNLAPPYGAVIIDRTDPLAAIPYLDASSSSMQPVADRVRLVLYGLQSNEAIDYLNAIIQYSRDTQNFGLMSMPTISDERRTQTELQAIAMKKTIDFRVSYTQSRVNTVAQKLILSAIPTVIVNS